MHSVANATVALLHSSLSKRFVRSRDGEQVPSVQWNPTLPTDAATANATDAAAERSNATDAAAESYQSNATAAMDANDAARSTHCPYHPITGSTSWVLHPTGEKQTTTRSLCAASKRSQGRKRSWKGMHKPGQN